MRADARFCAEVATVEQAAALRGVSVATLTGREASWANGGVDIVGPDFGASWAGPGGGSAGQAHRELRRDRPQAPLG